jgi:hypothetical protein
LPQKLIDAILVHAWLALRELIYALDTNLRLRGDARAWCLDRSAAQLSQSRLRSSVIWLSAERSAIEINSLSAGIVLLAYVAELEKGIGMLGFEAECLSEVTLSERRIALPQRDHAKAVMCLCRRVWQRGGLEEASAAFIIPMLF